jgi:hypothetical protein
MRAMYGSPLKILILSLSKDRGFCWHFASASSFDRLRMRPMERFVP